MSVFGAPFTLMPGAAVAEDADAAAYLATQASVGPAPEPAWRAAVDALVIGLKADGNWTPVSTMALLTGPRSLAGIVVPLRGPTLTSVNFVADDYSRTLGLQSNGSTKYLNHNFAGSSLAQNNISMGAYATGSVPSGAGRFVCAAFDEISVLAGASAAGARARVSSGTLTTLGSGTTMPCMVGVSRAASNSFTWRAFGQSGTVTQNSEAGTRYNVLSFASTDAAGFQTAGTLPSGTRLTAVWAGAAVDLAAMETRLADYHAAIGAAL